MALRVCAAPGCPEWTDATYCTAHRRARGRESRSLYSRERYGSEWPAIRRRKLARSPSCECADAACGVCAGAGCSSPANEVDHVIPLRHFTDRAAAHELGNLQSLCKPCHSSKTAREVGLSHPKE